MDKPKCEKCGKKAYKQLVTVPSRLDEMFGAKITRVYLCKAHLENALESAESSIAGTAGKE